MDSYSYHSIKPNIERYNAQKWDVPYRVEQVTVGDGEEAVIQYRCVHLLIDHPSDDDIRTKIAEALCAEVNTYINSHYDPGTQQTLQALMIMDSVPQALKDSILTIWPWIQSALAYYYGKKTEVLSAADPKIVTWDFGLFDATKPDITLNGIMAALAG